MTSEQKVGRWGMRFKWPLVWRSTLEKVRRENVLLRDMLRQVREVNYEAMKDTMKAFNNGVWFEPINRGDGG